MYIGKKLKTLRREKNITLQELAEKSGVQIATISRIENLKMIGTLESHMALAKALDIDLKDLYSDIIKEGSAIDIQAKATARDVFVHNDKAKYEILTTNVLQKKMMPSLLNIEPQGETTPESHKMGTERFIYVLNESIDIHIGKQQYTLKQGDSLYFDATQEHNFTNTGKKTAAVLIMTTPAQF